MITSLIGKKDSMGLFIGSTIIKGLPKEALSCTVLYYIMPMSGPAAGAAGAGAGISVTAHSVVRMRAAMAAAF